jgi:Domain of unknown function (DUF4349)
MSNPRKFAFAAISFLALAGVVGVACGGGGKASMPVSGALEGGAPMPAASPAPAARGGDDLAALNQFQLPRISQRIIKTASVTLLVRKGTFQQRLQEAVMVAGSHGGFVSSSQTSQARLRSGVMVIRVPASEFEAAMGELKALGTVKAERVSGEDMTAQFVDLQARLRNWEAQETVLLRLMRKSTSIEDSLKVQRTLQDVQLAIEEIRGQLRVLDDQTQFSTITLTMAESGTSVAEPKKELTFFRAWHQAIHAIATVFAAVVIGLGYVIPLALIALVGLVLWLVYRRVRPRVATGGTPSGTA